MSLQFHKSFQPPTLPDFMDRNYKQVTWLVVTEVWSKCFGLVTERCHYNARPIYAKCSSASQFYFASSSVVSRAFSVRACTLHIFNIRHHPHSLGNHSSKIRFWCTLHRWASPRRKIAYSITHSPSLFDLPGTEAYRFEITTRETIQCIQAAT